MTKKKNDCGDGDGYGMKGAIYKNKDTNRYVRMYSSDEAQLKAPLDAFELVRVYDDPRELERDFSRLEVRVKKELITK